MPSQSLQSGRYQYLVISSVALINCVCPAANLKLTCGSKWNPLFFASRYSSSDVIDIPEVIGILGISSLGFLEVLLVLL